MGLLRFPKSRDVLLFSNNFSNSIKTLGAFGMHNSLKVLQSLSKMSRIKTKSNVSNNKVEFVLFTHESFLEQNIVLIDPGTELPNV